jgi:hypothetical protein
MPIRGTDAPLRGIVNRLRLSGESDPIQVFSGGASADAFGRTRVSQPFTLLDFKQVRNGLPLFFNDVTVSGTATSTYNTNQASTTLAVSATTAGVRVRQSKLRGVYQPGKGKLALVTGVFGAAVAGVTKRMGYFDDKNGLFFQQTGTALSVVRRSYVTGSAVDTVVTQANWNIDKMDGTGPSGVTLDLTKTQIIVIDFEWLGVGRVRYGWNVDGITYYCHEMLHANMLSVVYMGNPNLPIRYEIVNDGTGGAASLVCICASIASEGGNEDVAASTYISRNGTAATLANQDLYTPILSVRLKSDAIGLKANPLFVDVISTSNIVFEWRLYLNPTIAGTDNASWDSVNAASGLEFDIARDATNTVSGGYVLAGGYGASTGSTRLPVSGGIKSYLTLGTNVDGSSDELVLAVANIEANGGTVYGGMTVGEYL